MQAGDLAMVLILHTATTITGCRERACRRPLMDYLAEKMCTLCYQRARYAKLRGCIAIKFPFKRMDLRWVLHRQSGFLKALLFVMMDLTGGVSSGSVEMAKSNLERMRRHCARPLDRRCRMFHNALQLLILILSNLDQTVYIRHSLHFYSYLCGAFSPQLKF